MLSILYISFTYNTCNIKSRKIINITEHLMLFRISIVGTICRKYFFIWIHVINHTELHWKLLKSLIRHCNFYVMDSLLNSVPSGFLSCCQSEVIKSLLILLQHNCCIKQSNSVFTKLKKERLHHLIKLVLQKTHSQRLSNNGYAIPIQILLNGQALNHKDPFRYIPIVDISNNNCDCLKERTNELHLLRKWLRRKENSSIK